ncbi:MAG: hypothetical protein FJ295_12085 [Planctomycetes bacterium]|nr:hypothetical protein [Planctomycetota bacterium]
MSFAPSLTRKLAMAAALVFAAGFTTDGRLQADDGWKFPNLNPFKKSEETGSAGKKKTSAKFSDKNQDSSWKWWGSTKDASRSRAAEPSTWDKMSSGTKSLMAKTKSAITPWKSEETTTKRPATGTNRLVSKKKQEKSSWLPTWKTEKESSDGPRTLSDWVGLPKPE